MCNLFCQIRELEEKLERLIHLQQLAAVTDEEEYLIILEDAGFTNLEVGMTV